MINRLVLRWSGAQTIPVHQEIINRDGYVWWGWWAKSDQEFFPHDWVERATAEIAKNGSIKVGLVSRKDARYALGFCEEVSFAADGSRSPAPNDGASTPDYYRPDHCGAWFRLSRIDSLTIDEYLREFGEVPVGDATLYLAERDEPTGATTLYPRPNWSFEQMGCNGSSILHISDLHFGYYHGYPTVQPGAGRGVRSARLVDRIEQAVERSGASIGVVVVSGDLVSRGEQISQSLSDFETFADELLNKIGVSRDRCIIVPGNHDFLTVTDATAMKKDYSHELEFRQFIQRFYGWAAVGNTEQPFRFLLKSGVEFAGVALNSARLRDENSRDYGYIARHRYDRLLAMLRQSLEPGESPTILAGVFHHHLLPVHAVEPPQERRHVSITVDAGEVLERFGEAGVQMVLHGHQHLPFVGSVRTSRPVRAAWPQDPLGRDLTVLGCGSSGAAKSALPDAFPFNSLLIHTPVQDGSAIDVQLWSYLPGNEANRAASFNVPLDQTTF